MPSKRHRLRGEKGRFRSKTQLDKMMEAESYLDGLKYEEYHYDPRPINLSDPEIRQTIKDISGEGSPKVIYRDLRWLHWSIWVVSSAVAVAVAYQIGQWSRG